MHACTECGHSYSTPGAAADCADADEVDRYRQREWTEAHPEAHTAVHPGAGPILSTPPRG